MAHCMIEVEGTKTDALEQKPLISHLQKYKLPIHKFISYGADINDFIDFDQTYFKGLCNDMKLNHLESMRFARFIQELNQNESNDNHQHQIIKNIESNAQNAEQHIDETFDEFAQALHQRRNALKKKVTEICQQQMDAVRKEIIQYDPTSNFLEFICSDVALIYKNISNMGTIEYLHLYSKQLQYPQMTLSIADENVCCIKINLHQTKEEDIGCEIQYKEKETDEKKDSEDDCNWSTTNSLILLDEHIKPLTSYIVRVRYIKNTKNDCFHSQWCEPQSIVTGFDCIWDPRYCAKNIKLKDEHEIFVDGNFSLHNSLSIAAKYVLSHNMFKKITFEMKMNEFCQPSIIGFVKAPITETMKGYWQSDDVLLQNKNSFLVSAVDGLKSIYRYKNGKEMNGKRFALFNSGIALKHAIQRSDRFVFDVDFDSHCCNLYIKDVNDQQCKVALKDEATWSDIPNEIVPVYSHHCDSKLVQKNSNVIMNLLRYQLR